MNVRRLHFLSTLAAGVLLSPSAVDAGDTRASWTDTGATFAAGTLGESGQNLYINRRGELETIRRYDLDGNGHLDLLFNSTHDIFNAIPATLATMQGPTLTTAELAVDGSSRVLPRDMNADGYVDLVFMPNHQNVQQQRSSLMIAWGAPDGWTTNRLTRQLPVDSVTSLAIGDLNDDGWPDLLTLNGDGWLFGQPGGKIVRVYWGSKTGFLLTRYQDIGVPAAVEIATGGFGARREFPAVVLTASGALHFLGYDAQAKAMRVATTFETSLTEATKAQALLSQTVAPDAGDTLWIGTNTRSLVQVATSKAKPSAQILECAPATHLAIGRLDDDEWPDLILTDLKLVYPSAKSATPAATSVHVLWGQPDGVDAAHPVSLQIPNASAATVGDLNGDGHGDLVVAVFQGTESLKASSRVFLGQGGRQLTAEGLAVATEGAQGVAIARLTADAPPVAVFANSQHRTLDDAVPLRLYWGIPGGFSRDTFVDIPNLSGYKSSASDLNSDGYVDLIVINGGDISEDAAARAPHTGINIYWGGANGNMKGPGPTRFDFSRRQILPEKHLGSINVADLNRDGYLDLVLGAFESANSPDTQMIIYYGNADGLSAAHRHAVEVPGRSIGCLIADFNRDGELDIVIGSYTTNQVITFWGKDGRYDNRNQTILPYPAPIDLEAADFNGDGWLDLVVASYEDTVAHHHDTGSSIFWGGEKGWHQSASQWLPGMTPVGIAVADVDGDGYLDFISPHYHGELSREQLPSYIFWGSAEGFAARHRTSLIVDSASEVIVADFNGDGKRDIAFAAHSIDPGHLVESPVFYNDGNRFKSPEVQYLPVAGPHYTWVQDIGNISHRRDEETFTSRVFAFSNTAAGGSIAVDATTPHRSHVSIQVRSAASENALDAAPWREAREGAFPLLAGDRAVQYRLTLHSANADAYPIVRKVSVSLK